MSIKPSNFTLGLSSKPLPELLRPSTLTAFIGQPHIVGPRSFLVSEINRGNLVSSIFWGPPGVGKTTLARILTGMANYNMVELSAVKASLSDVKQFLKQAEGGMGRFALFLDEIHRFNKLQQDALLPSVESGDIVLLGATTENPAFGIIPALRSRMRIFQFRPLEAAHIRIGVERGIEHLQQRDGTVIEIEIMDQLILFGGGDLRNTLLLLEDVYSFARGPETRVVLTKEALEAAANRLISDYDGGYDAHYDHASAFQKSLRGSSVDGALYWLGKMLEGGEDPMFIARRLVITASEDVGMADPMALLQAQAAMDAIRNIGMPEARLPLTQAVIYIASAPKSNSVISAISKVTATLREGHSYGVPPHLKDSHFSSAASQGSGLGYVYPHTRGSAVITYLPTQIERPDFYMPLSEAENLRMRNLDGFLRNHHNPPTAPDKTLEKKLLDLIAQKSGSPIKTEDFAQEMGLSPAEVYHLLVNLERSGRITIDKWATIEITGE